MPLLCILPIAVYLGLAAYLVWKSPKYERDGEGMEDPGIAARIVRREDNVQMKSAKPRDFVFQAGSRSTTVC